MNKFINVSFDKAASSINLMYINQPKESEKFYTVRYGPVNSNCRDLPLQTKGHLSNSNSVSVELNLNLDDTTEVCFSVVVSNGTKRVSMEGVYSVTSKCRVAELSISPWLYFMYIFM